VTTAVEIVGTQELGGAPLVNAEPVSIRKVGRVV